jgi:hypothetical protein
MTTTTTTTTTTPVLCGWVNPETDLEEWADAPLNEVTLRRYLMAAFGQCMEYLPYVLSDTGARITIYPDPPYDRYILAQIAQARALWRAALAGTGDQLGADGLGVTVFPMDWHVKNLLRPRIVGRMG